MAILLEKMLLKTGKNRKFCELNHNHRAIILSIFYNE